LKRLDGDRRFFMYLLQFLPAERLAKSAIGRPDAQSMYCQTDRNYDRAANRFVDKS